MLTIAPPRSWSRMTSPIAYEHAIVPLRSTASRTSSLRSHSHVAASPVSTSAPALLTHTSTRPSSSRASATRRSQPSRVARSAWRTTARPPPAADTASATARARSGEARCVRSTTAPSPAYVSAIARPIPPLAHRVDDGAGDGCLGGAEHLHRLRGTLDRDLVGHDRVRLGREVGRHHREEVRVTLLLVDQGFRERFANRPALRADQEVDVRDLVTLADERLSYRQRQSHGPSLWLSVCLRNQ